MNKDILAIFQIILGLSLVGLIILQSKGTGLGSTFGSSTSFYSTRRGAEKVVFVATVVLAVAFIIVSLLGVII